MDIPEWFFDDENEEDTLDELSKLDIDDDFGFLASSERTQCQFVNTIGMRCPDRYWGNSLCCKNHQCTFMFNKTKQCTSTMDCHTKWYCTKHSKKCKCQFNENNEPCSDMIYFHIYKSGCKYCFKHQCSSHGCPYPIGDNKYKLCKFHYDELIFCCYVGSDGNQCTEIIDRMELSSDKIMEKNINNEHVKNIIISNEKNVSPHQILYCSKHTCHVRNCRYHIRNDFTPWCRLHSVRCDFKNSTQLDKNELFWDIQTSLNYDTNTTLPEQVLVSSFDHDESRCQNYVLCPNPGSSSEDNENPVFCSEHLCHWEGNLSDWKKICIKSSVKKDDCSLYCEEHYQIYKFHKFEYTIQ